MRHFSSYKQVNLQDAWLTIGAFDGVHLGHQAIIRNLTAGAHARGEPAVVLTFHPHPAVVLGKLKDCLCLTTPEDKADLLGQLGVDMVITQPFDLELAALSAREFLADLLRTLKMRQLWVGYDFALGRERQGTVNVLRNLGEEFGYQLHVFQPVQVDGETVSSSQIRALLGEGEVKKANRLLDRPYAVSGEVVHGDGRGKSIGFPTANLAVWSDLVLPKNGIYVCHAWLDGAAHQAVVNVGTRPTFDQEAVVPRVEAYLLDLNRDLYGQRLRLEFLERLRDEVRFASVEALIEQIKLDVMHARQYLLNPPASA